MLRSTAAALTLLTLTACPAPSVEDSGTMMCTASSCAMGQYCDGTSCVTGCDEQADCASDENCDNTTHTCSCPSGTHRCGTACAPDTDVATCGTSCTACPAVSNGAPTCGAGQCGVTCNLGTLQCGAACATCPLGAVATQCSGSSCVATSCQASRQLCQGQCAQCPVGTATGACSGIDCHAATCQPGRLLCANQCPSCPEGATTTQCSGAGCDATTCAAGRLLCSGQCPQCPANATATACSGTTCVATACNPGFVTCGGTCVACAPGLLFCCREPVESNVGPDHALALDGMGRPYIGYYANGTLKLARGGPTGFTFVTVDTAGDVGKGVSIAVDSAGNAHLAYTRAMFPMAVKYAYVPLTGAVVVETIEPDLIEIGGTSIALDSSGAVQVAYYAGGDGHWATKAGGAWRSRYVMRNGRQPSLAVSGVTPHIVASSNPAIGAQACSLAYAWLDAGTADGGFTTSTVSSSLGISQFHEANIAIDGTGQPIVAYMRPNFQDLRFAVLDGGVWQSATIQNGLVSNVQLAVGPDGPRVAFKGTPGGGSATFRPRYGELTATGWQFQLIVDQDITVGDLSLALDPSGRPNVTYWDPNPALRRVYWVH